MGTAAQIRAFRVRAGKARAEMAKSLGLNEAWYEDLERHDQELASTLTLFQAMELASALGVSLRDLVPDHPAPEEPISLMQLPDLIRARMSRDDLSIEQLENKVGGELKPFLDSPLQGASEFPIVFLQAIATYLGINWLALVPTPENG
jgi:transcriptional regulator with XRE-family HTH domain